MQNRKERMWTTQIVGEIKEIELKKKNKKDGKSAGISIHTWVNNK